MNVFNRILCKESIKLEPRCVNKEFKTEVLRRLKQKVEGICTKHGFIKHDTIEIHKITPGVIELISLCGNVVYDVYFYAEVCNPALGTVIQATVSNINRFGILAESGYKQGDDYISVIEVIIAKNSVNIQSEIDLETLKIGDDIRVEILGRKFELGSKKISSIGRVINGGQVGGVKSGDKEDQDDEDEEEFEENESGESADSEEEEEEEEEEEDDDEEEENIHEHEEDEEEKASGFFSDGDSFFSEAEDEEFVDDDKDGASSGGDLSESDV